MNMLGPRQLIPSTSMLMAFDAAARSGSFTLAAKELNLTQGGVSRQINALETQLGIQLFTREGRSVHLNEAGDIYAKEVALALQTIRNASLNAISAPFGRVLNFSILPTFGMRWLMPRFPEFLKLNPQLTVNFSTNVSSFDFQEENIHAAIHYGNADWPDADCTFLMREDAIPVAAPVLASRAASQNNFNQPADIMTMPLLHLDTRPLGWKDWFDQNGVDAPLAAGMVFDQWALVIQAAIAGMGAALVPRFLIEAELAKGDLIPLSPTPLSSDDGYYFVTPKNRSTYVPAVALKNWLKEITQSLDV